MALLEAVESAVSSGSRQATTKAQGERRARDAVEAGQDQHGVQDGRQPHRPDEGAQLKDPRPVHLRQPGIDQGRDAHRGEWQHPVQGLHQQRVQGMGAAEQGRAVVGGDAPGGEGRQHRDEDDVQHIALRQRGEHIARDEVRDQPRPG